MDLDRALRIAASGMDVQTRRLRVVAENLANRDTTAETAGGDPYRRKTVTFANRFDLELGVNTPKVRRVGPDPWEFNSRFDPSPPSAAPRGPVTTPQLNSPRSIT